MVFRSIFFLFIAMPILEIFLLIKVGSSIGALATIAIVVFTAILGTWMLRAQGLSTLNKAQSKMSGGQVPAFEMMEGLALGVGGALLLTPGFVTDAIGFACLVPFTRKLLVTALSKRVTVGAVTGGFAGAASGRQSPFGSASRPNAHGRSHGRSSQGQSHSQSHNQTSRPSRGGAIDGEIIEGEFTREEE